MAQFYLSLMNLMRKDVCFWEFKIVFLFALYG